jgi:hypothetical protein
MACDYLYAWLAANLLLGCSPHPPPHPSRSCMSEVQVVTSSSDVKRADAIEVSVICSTYMREHCIELLRERACELGSRRVVIRFEKPAPTASSNRVRDLEVRNPLARSVASFAGGWRRLVIGDVTVDQGRA